MSTHIQGFGIRGYRSFGETQHIYPLSKINLFVGQNNCGKSNVLRFVSALKIVSTKRQQGEGISSCIPNTHLNRHQGKFNHPIEFSLPVDLSNTGIEKLGAELFKNNQLFKDRGTGFEGFLLLKKLFEGLRTELEGDELWFRFSSETAEVISPKPSDFLNGHLPKYIHDREWADLWYYLTNQTSGSLTQHWIPEVFQKLNPFPRFSLPDVLQIQEQRKIGATGTEMNGHNGDGLIDRLAELERPSYEKQDLKKQFEKLNAFVKEVIENDTARIEIPSDRSTINVEVDGRLLPIESLGSGIHQVIILGAAATTITNSVVSIEEPEVHLHPQLQRKLLNYLSKETSNQYFITTHSAHLLDAKETSVFHVRLEDGQSIITLANSPTTRHSICHDLGYRASDIMQSPCVIWVEGPSDRIYLRHWLKQIEPSLDEDIHYSIMFYGGRLLSHLTPSDPEVKDFISLRRLNRNLVVLIDGDQEKKGAQINTTKQRVADAFTGDDGFAWITAGREIENYVNSEELASAMAIVSPTFHSLADTGQFGKSLNFFPKKGPEIANGVDKVKLARQLCSQEMNLNKFDLSKQLSKLITYIKKANHLG